MGMTKEEKEAAKAEKAAEKQRQKEAKEAAKAEKAAAKQREKVRDE